ncbi:MAG: hypothetical protein KQJ78_13075 [Deltaproteobacteria bacterium]|nr:hypothetical protein [Deltaproteobacteria bacterium]
MAFFIQIRQKRDPPQQARLAGGPVFAGFGKLRPLLGIFRQTITITADYLGSWWFFCGNGLMRAMDGPPNNKSKRFVIREAWQKRGFAKPIVAPSMEPCATVSNCLLFQSCAKQAVFNPS